MKCNKFLYQKRAIKMKKIWYFDSVYVFQAIFKFLNNCEIIKEVMKITKTNDVNENVS